MKTLVIHNKDESAVPFLRGILTRSLLDAGMDFEAAFDVATDVRDLLADTQEVASETLHDLVLEILEKRGLKEVTEAYQSPLAAPAPIEVHSLSGNTSAFSRGRHARYLQSSGMKSERAEQTTLQIYDQLLASGVTFISTCQLGFLTYLYLKQEVSDKAAHRYLVWSAYQRSGRPLILMMCGTVGSGKSTVASELAHLLEIVRTQSTDMLREVMRMMIPQRLLPILHESSFNAWQALTVHEEDTRDRDMLVADGYCNQADLLAVPCEAVMQRAIAESVPLILEGVHARAGLISLVPEESDAIVVHLTLAVLKKKELKARLRGRGVEVPKRRAERYLNSMASIWSLQSFLLSEADLFQAPIISNKDKEKCIVQITQHVNQVLSQHFAESASAVFDAQAGFEDVAELGLSWQFYLAGITTHS